MFEEVNLGECLKSSAVVTGYLLLTVGILFTLSYTGYIETGIFDGISLEMTILGVATIFNLVFAFTIVDQNY